jgi:hypothetical protein
MEEKIKEQRSLTEPEIYLTSFRNVYDLNPGWDLLFSVKYKVAFLNPFLLTKQK